MNNLQVIHFVPAPKIDDEFFAAKTQRLALKLYDHPIDLIITSTSKDAAATTKVIAQTKMKSCTVLQSEFFDERYAKNDEEEGLDFLCQRGEKGLSLIASKPQRHIVVITHKEIFSALFAAIGFGDINTFAGQRLYLVVKEGGISTFTHHPPQRWTMHCFNNVSHLEVEPRLIPKQY